MNTLKTTFSAIVLGVASAASTGASEAGLQAEYFDNVNLSGAPRATRIDPLVGLFYGDASGAAAEGLGADYWSARWTGQITVPETGAWTFGADVDDGLRLWIDGQLILDHWNQAPDTYLGLVSRTISLQAGKSYAVKAEYQDFFSDAYLVLRWTSPSGTTETVPAAAYAQTAPPPPTGVDFPLALTTDANVVTGPFDVRIASGLELGALAPGAISVVNGTVTALASTGSTLVATVTPTEPGSVFVSVPAGGIPATGGGLNLASNTIQVAYSAPVGNRAPVVNFVASQFAVRGGPVVLANRALDPEGQTVTFSAENLPLGLEIDPTTGLISGRVDPAAADSYESRVFASDGEKTASASFMWTITSQATTTVNGLAAEYFSDTALQNKVLERVDPKIDFLWPDGTSPAPGVPHDNFSARWTGSLKFDSTEVHTLTADVDDGIRVWVAGYLVIDKWNPVPGTYYNVQPRFLLRPKTAGGHYPITIEFQDHFSDALVRLKWEAAGLPRQIIPADHFFTAGPANSAPVITGLHDTSTLQWQRTFLAIRAHDPDAQDLHMAVDGLPPGLTFDEATRSIAGVPTATGTWHVAVAANDGSNRTLSEFDWTIHPFAGGLTGQYFDGTTFGALKAERQDSVVNFWWGANAPIDGVNADAFSAVWTGSVVPAFTETYTFIVLADDGVRLWVNGRLVIDKWDGRGLTDAAGSIDLVAGQPAAIRLEYAEKGGNALAELCWFSPHVSKRHIPQERLVPVTDVGGVTFEIPESAETWLESPTLAAVQADCDNALASSRVEVGPDGVAHFVFSTLEGLTSLYRVESSEDLVTWKNEPSGNWFIPPTGDGRETVRVYGGPVPPAEGAAPQRYYRLGCRKVL